jgi:hypothetical protein
VQPVPATQALLLALAEVKLETASKMDRLFKDPWFPPDLEVGCMAFCHAPAGTRHDGWSLARIAPRMGKLGCGRPVPVVTMVRQEAALAVADIKGEAARAALLAGLTEGRLVGRKVLEDAAIELAHDLMEHRLELSRQGQQMPQQVQWQPPQLHSQLLLLQQQQQMQQQNDGGQQVEEVIITDDD